MSLYLRLFTLTLESRENVHVFLLYGRPALKRRFKVFFLEVSLANMMFGTRPVVAKGHRGSRSLSNGRNLVSLVPCDPDSRDGRPILFYPGSGTQGTIVTVENIFQAGAVISLAAV